MRWFPSIVSYLLVLGACDSEGTSAPDETETGTSEGVDSHGAEGGDGGEASSTGSEDPTGASTNPDPTGASATGEDPTGADPTGDTTTGDPTGGETTGSTATGGMIEPQLPPGDLESLIAWLQAGEYEGWTAESGIHDSDGPHFGNVRTFVNNVLVDSFESGNQIHPIGVATVKELYGPGQTIRGWSVSIKREVDAGQWYWFEVWDGDVLADTVAWDVCEDCHGDGTDNVLTPWPLQ